MCKLLSSHPTSLTFKAVCRTHRCTQFYRQQSWNNNINPRKKKKKNGIKRKKTYCQSLSDYCDNGLLVTQDLWLDDVHTRVMCFESVLSIGSLSFSFRNSLNYPGVF